MLFKLSFFIHDYLAIQHLEKRISEKKYKSEKNSLHEFFEYRLLDNYKDLV